MENCIETVRNISFVIPDVDSLFSTIELLESFYTSQGIDYEYNVVIEDEINVIFKIWKKNN